MNLPFYYYYAVSLLLVIFFVVKATLPDNDIATLIV